VKINDNAQLTQNLISVVIPVYNADSSLRELADRIQAAFDSMGQDYEIIFVEDRGTDNSWLTIEDLSAKHDHIRGIRFQRNYGQHAAVLCGVRAAKGELCLTMDDDLQHEPEHIPRILAALTDATDVLYVTPQTQPHGLCRGLASKVVKWALSSAMGASSAANISAWRLFRTKVRDAFQDYRGPYVVFDAMLAWGTSAFSFVRVEHVARPHGRSGYTYWKLAKHAFTVVAGFTILPLQFATLLGVTMAAFGLLSLIYVAGQALMHGSAVPGFAFTASLISILSGSQLFALGIIGEYIARIHSRTTGQPTYVVGSSTHGADLAHANLVPN
jgi:undecaprenyl-phosphate 4-deoxy-4-formamido-L-arabinose transferase